jgi:hypothetical protein
LNSLAVNPFGYFGPPPAIHWTSPFAQTPGYCRFGPEWRERSNLDRFTARRSGLDKEPLLAPQATRTVDRETGLAVRLHDGDRNVDAVLVDDEPELLAWAPFQRIAMDVDAGELALQRRAGWREPLPLGRTRSGQAQQSRKDQDLGSQAHVSSASSGVTRVIGYPRPGVLATAESILVVNDPDDSRGSFCLRDEPSANHERVAVGHAVDDGTVDFSL